MSRFNIILRDRDEIDIKVDANVSSEQMKDIIFREIEQWGSKFRSGWYGLVYIRNLDVPSDGVGILVDSGQLIEWANQYTL